MFHAAIGRVLAFVVRRLLPRSFVWLFARRFIAGITRQEAFETAKSLSQQGFSVSLNYLGEDISNRILIQWTRGEYCALLDDMGKRNVRGDIALKLSQFGLLMEHESTAVPDGGISCVESIVAHAKTIGSAQGGIRVWIDAELLRWREDTWRIAAPLSKKYGNVGICIQAYAEDAVEFLDEQIRGGWRGPIRVCKGAYRESKELLVQSESCLVENFTALCDLVLENDIWLQIATHDERLVKKIRRYGPREHGMLLGVNPECAVALAAEDQRVRIYASYGADFKGYVARRIAERPGYILLPFRGYNRSH